MRGFSWGKFNKILVLFYIFAVSTAICNDSCRLVFQPDDVQPIVDVIKERLYPFAAEKPSFQENVVETASFLIFVFPKNPTHEIPVHELEKFVIDSAHNPGGKHIVAFSLRYVTIVDRRFFRQHGCELINDLDELERFIKSEELLTSREAEVDNRLIKD